MCCWSSVELVTLVRRLYPFWCVWRTIFDRYCWTSTAIAAWIVPLFGLNNWFYWFCDWNWWYLLNPFDYDQCCWYYWNRNIYNLYDLLHRCRGTPKLSVFLRLQLLFAYLRSTAHQNTHALTKCLQTSLHTEITKIVPQILQSKKAHIH